MKKIGLILLMAGIGLTTQFVHAQDNDTSKNKIEVKKKVKTGVHGRQVTKIKIEGKGTPDAINSAAASATTGKTRVVVAPAPTPTPPQVVVVNRNAEPKPATTTVTTTTETKPVVTSRQTTTSAIRTSTAHVVHTTTPVKRRPVRHVYRTVNKKPAVAATTKTTTTTTVKKEQ